MNGPDYDGRVSYRPHGGARKPANFDAMVQAAITGDALRWAAEVRTYREQCENDSIDGRSDR